MDRIIDSTSGSNTEALWDAVIIGGGAAGLSAGVVLARAQFKTLVVDGGEPRNGPAHHMHGYLTRDGMAPGEFLATGRAELTRYGGTVMAATVTDARPVADSTFELSCGDRVLRARSVLVATGLTDELPDIPGLSERWASQVHHCPHCHGHEVRGQAIAVIGGQMGAVSKHLAALMRRYSPTVTFCLNGIDISAAERQRLTAYGVRLIDADVTRVVDRDGTGQVTIELADGGSVQCQAIFVAPRPIPHDEALAMLGASRDSQSGLVDVDPHGATDVPGVWAAGNVVNPRAQVVTAAGAGSTAAINMAGWLLERELSAAVSGQELEGAS